MKRSSVLLCAGAIVLCAQAVDADEPQSVAIDNMAADYYDLGSGNGVIDSWGTITVTPARATELVLTCTTPDGDRYPIDQASFAQAASQFTFHINTRISTAFSNPVCQDGGCDSDVLCDVSGGAELELAVYALGAGGHEPIASMEVSIPLGP